MGEPTHRERREVVPSAGEGASPLTESDFHDSLLRALSGVHSEAPLPLPGERLGGLDGARYEVLAPLGGGGMGQVFRALDHELRRTVALKFLVSGPRLAEPERRERLLREEAQAIARLDHENIVRIHDVSMWNPGPRGASGSDTPRVPFLVMELLEGESLQALLRREPLDARRALDILVDVAAGLAHAHERGLVHRDLKPGNVFILRGGRAKLLDFGLARLSVGPPSADVMDRAGTPPYMAPEQWAGGPVDTRADVWAAGVLLFQLLSGRVPLRERRTRELRARVLSAEPMPSVRERRPELPEAVERLVASTLAKDVAARPASGAVLLERLCALREQLAPRVSRSAGAVLAGRRQVTLVSCRLSLRPAAGRHLDPEDAVELEMAFHRASEDVLRQHGGTPLRAGGSDVLACFGFPVAREDDAECAVRAALRLTETLLGGASDARIQGVETRVGVHSDLVVLAAPPAGADGAAPNPQGEAPGVARWLAERAAPGTVLLSDATRALVRGRFRGKALGTGIFQGLSGASSMGLHQVLGESRGVSRFDGSRIPGALSPLVGRERELRQLAAWRDAPPGEEGTFVLLRGDAGVGKSRLVQELHDREPPGVSTWARCQCWPQYGHSTFHPLIEWLQRFLELAPEDAPARRRQRLDAWLGVLGLPREQCNPLASLLSLPIAEGAPFLHLSAERQRERILEGLAALLRHSASRRPLVLVVEDLHWADPSTLQFLDVLPRQLDGAAVRVLLTARPGFQHTWAGRPGFHVLEVEPLSPEDTAVLVREASREHSLPDAMVARLVASSDGIPLFAEELTRAVLELGGKDASSPDVQPIPATLSGLLLARLDALAPRPRAQLQLAATLGREFSYELLRAVSFLPEAGLVPELEQLERAGLLFRWGAPPFATYAFRHALIQDAAYQCLLRSTRQRHHARVVQALELEFPELVEDQPELVAQHATKAGMTSRAVDLWQRAGQRALEKSAIAEAAEHHFRALEQLLLLPASRERDRREVALRGELGLALVLARGFAPEEVRTVYTRALELSDSMGDTPIQVLWGLWNTAMVRGDADEADVLASRMRRLLGTSLEAEPRMVVHGALSFLHYWRGDYAGCRMHGLQVRALFATQPPPRSFFQTYGGRESYVVEQILYGQLFLAVSELQLGMARTAQASYRTALALAESMHHPYALATAQMFGIAMDAETYRLEEARTVAERACATCEENGFSFVMAHCRCFQGLVLALLGTPEEGIEKAREGLGMLRAMGARLVYSFCTACLAQACLSAGQLDEAAEVIDEGLALMKETRAGHYLPELLRLRGEVYLLRGKRRAAREAFEQALGAARGFGSVRHVLRVGVSLALLLRDSGESDEAHAVLTAACAGAPPDEDLPDLGIAQRLLAELS